MVLPGRQPSPFPRGEGGRRPDEECGRKSKTRYMSQTSSKVIPCTFLPTLTTRNRFRPPAAGLTFLFRQESKQRSRPGGGAEFVAPAPKSRPPPGPPPGAHFRFCRLRFSAPFGSSVKKKESTPQLHGDGSPVLQKGTSYRKCIKYHCKSPKR